MTECELIFISNKFLNKIDLSKEKNRISEAKYLNILKNDFKEDFSDNFDKNSLAEIIFTSGSTGTPKGVMISHENIMANTNSILKYLVLNSSDIVCIVLPFYYCYGLSLLHTHLKVGGSIVLNNSFMFLGTVIKDLITYKCTGFSGVPSHFQMLLKKSNSFKITEFPDLRYVTQAGGKLSNSFIEEFIDSFPKINFFVMYGQTEATARLSFLDPNDLKNKPGSIGKAIPDVTLKIIDEYDNEVGPEIVGELIAKGKNIMQGYFKDPLLTNTILKNNWLYTGDLVKKDKDGDIFIIARKKEIIKVAGHRVSPKEIEEVISTVNGVIDCTVKGVNDDLQGEAITAYIVIDNIDFKKKINEDILLKCKENLALYKIPQFIEFTDQLHFKLTGKK